MRFSPFELPFDAMLQLILVIVLSSALLITGCAPKEPGEPVGTPEELEGSAQEFMVLTSEGKYDDARKLFDSKMSKAVSVSQLKSLWEDLLSQGGDWQKLEDVTFAEESGYRVIYMKALFEKGSVDAKIVFNNDAQIAGLWFGSFVSSEYSPPSYADQDLFVEKDVVVGEGDWVLPGTLTLPKSASQDNRVPAVVVVHGSGPLDRDGTIGPNKPYKDLAWGLASRGIAVLRYEKRTKQYQDEFTGGSADATNMTINEETIDDAISAVVFLKTVDEVDPTKIFIVGHSLGATVGPKIAQKCGHISSPASEGGSSIAGLVMMAATSRNLLDVIIEQVEYLAALDGNVDADEAQNVNEVRSSVEKIKSGQLAEGEFVLGAPKAYWDDLLAYDQVETTKQLTLPILILQGERDYQVTPTDLDIWKEALQDKSNVSIKVYPDLNHLFMSGLGKSSPNEYIEPSNVSPEVIKDIAEWIESASATGC